MVVTDQAEAIGGLQKTYSGGQFARGGPQVFGVAADYMRRETIGA